MRVILIIIIIVMILFLLFTNDNKNLIEGYDARFINTSFPDCAQFCKTISNCYGFGYDKGNNICYPSKSVIQGRPSDSIFRDQYVYENATCNKIKAIDQPGNKIPFTDRRSNSVYTCSEAYNIQPQFYFQNLGEFVNIGEGRNIDDIFDVDDYEVFPFKWPLNKFNYNQLDLLVKGRESQTFIPSNITDLNRIVNYAVSEEEAVQSEQEVPEETASEQEINIKPILDFRLQNLKNRFSDFINNFKKPNLLVPTSTYSGESIYTEEEERPTFISYKENPNLNTGQYLRDYKCIQDIPLKDCLHYCSSNNQCVGVEWNPNYNSYNNVCCPYKTISNYISRPSDKTLGKFYEKTQSSTLNKQDDYVDFES
jgi:hypothetical protein